MQFRNQLGELLDQWHGAATTDEWRREHPLSVVYFNVENLKLYNERFGFGAGDEMLDQVGDAVKAAYPDAIIARFAADHVGVATTDADAIAGINVVRAEFRKHHKDSSILLKAGVYAAGPDDDDPGVVYDRAKIACDSIKGRRDVYYREYDAELKHQIELNRYVLDHFDEAIENEWIKIFYQPIIRVATGEVCDEEALARWVDPVEGLLSPFEFISVLEEARIIHKLDLYMVRRVCENFKHIRRGGLEEVPVSVNLSRLDFELCDILAEIEAILDEYDFPHDMIVFEVTESALAGNQEFLKGEIDRFREAGFEVWMDDFGSGYSSLNLLKEYSFDLVKIDMGFLRDFETNEQTRIMLAHIVSMCKELGLKTLVEGVETERQLSFLKGIGCGRAQGFLLGEPASLTDSLDAASVCKYPAIEARSFHNFYEAVGRVNLMRPDPAEPLNGHYVPGDLAAAIISRVNGRYEYLNVSDVYREHLANLGVDSVEKAAQHLNCPGSPAHECFESVLAEMNATDEWHDCAYTSTSGKDCSMHVKIVAQDAAHDAIALLSIVSESER